MSVSCDIRQETDQEIFLKILIKFPEDGCLIWPKRRKNVHSSPVDRNKINK